MNKGAQLTFCIVDAEGCNYSAGISVDHPFFVAWYCKVVVPLLFQIKDWPADYMQEDLSSWLNHHQSLLVDLGMWADAGRLADSLK